MNLYIYIYILVIDINEKNNNIWYGWGNYIDISSFVVLWFYSIVIIDRDGVDEL